MSTSINRTGNWSEIGTGPVLIQCHGETRVTNDAIRPFRSPEQIRAMAPVGTSRVIVSA